MIKYVEPQEDNMELSCGESIYNPDTSNREVIDCEISLTSEAITVLKGLSEGKELWLYIMVKGGGCSGYIYELELSDDEPTQEHQVITQDEIKVVVHNLDSSLLNGLQITYEDKLMGGGFKMENPNAKRSCGCGLSFG
jgi:iron-sulfur cluster assembly protein